MRQHTTPEQTAKLIELGVEKPKSIWALSRNCPSDKQLSYESSLGLTIRVEERFIPEYGYSIGELIEMLPHSMAFSDGDWNLCIDVDIYGEELAWQVGFIGEFFVKDKELIDALYDMIIKLKEEEVI